MMFYVINSKLMTTGWANTGKFTPSFPEANFASGFKHQCKTTILYVTCSKIYNWMLQVSDFQLVYP